MTNKANTETTQQDMCVIADMHKVVQDNISDSVGYYLGAQIGSAVGYGVDYIFGDHIINLAGKRSQYVETVRELSTKVEAEKAKGQGISEAFAREMFNERNEVKEDVRAEMYKVELIPIYVRNLINYKNIYGPTYEYYVGKGKTSQQIAEGACRDGGGDLGLKSNMVNELYKTFASSAYMPPIEEVNPASIPAEATSTDGGYGTLATIAGLTISVAGVAIMTNIILGSVSAYEI
jgi:hypothetical protein